MHWPGVNETKLSYTVGRAQTAADDLRRQGRDLRFVARSSCPPTRPSSGCSMVIRRTFVGPVSRPASLSTACSSRCGSTAAPQPDRRRREAKIADDDNLGVSFCYLNSPAGALDESEISTIPESPFEIVTLVATVAFSTSERVTFTCNTQNPGVYGQFSKILAVSVANLHP